MAKHVLHTPALPSHKSIAVREVNNKEGHSICASGVSEGSSLYPSVGTKRLNGNEVSQRLTYVEKGGALAITCTSL